MESFSKEKWRNNNCDEYFKKYGCIRLLEWFYSCKRLKSIPNLENEQIYYQSLWNKEKWTLNMFILSVSIGHNFLYIPVV
jgi:hypothetical protein